MLAQTIRIIKETKPFIQHSEMSKHNKPIINISKDLPSTTNSIPGIAMISPIISLCFFNDRIAVCGDIMNIIAATLSSERTIPLKISNVKIFKASLHNIF